MFTASQVESLNGRWVRVGWIDAPAQIGIFIGDGERGIRWVELLTITKGKVSLDYIDPAQIISIGPLLSEPDAVIEMEDGYDARRRVRK